MAPDAVVAPPVFGFDAGLSWAVGVAVTGATGRDIEETLRLLAGEAFLVQFERQ